MARTEIPVTTIDRTGVASPAQTDSDATEGMFIANNNARIIFEIENTDVGPQTVGFAIFTTVDDEPVDDKVVTIPAGEIRLAGPYPQDFYNQEDNSLYINPSVDANIKFRAYRLSSD
jgi:hypothetical protein